jgi:phosphate/sulfate permease
MNQITSSALIGAGMADRRSKLRWDVVQELLLAWTATLPGTALVAIAIYPIAHLLIR